MSTLAKLYEKYSGSPAPLISPSRTTKKVFAKDSSILKCDLDKLFFKVPQQSSDWISSWFKQSSNNAVLNQFAIYVHEVVTCTQLMLFTAEDKKDFLVKTLTALAAYLQQDVKLKPFLKALSNFADYIKMNIDWVEIYGTDNLPNHLNTKLTTKKSEETASEEAPLLAMPKIKML